MVSSKIKGALILLNTLIQIRRVYFTCYTIFVTRVTHGFNIRVTVRNVYPAMASSILEKRRVTGLSHPKALSRNGSICFVTHN